VVMGELLADIMRQWQNESPYSNLSPNILFFPLSGCMVESPIQDQLWRRIIYVQRQQRLEYLRQTIGVVSAFTIFGILRIPGIGIRVPEGRRSVFLRIAIRDRSAAKAWLGGDLGCGERGGSPLITLRSYVEARLTVSFRPCRRAEGCVSYA
jgi:hypothetical protein